MLAMPPCDTLAMTKVLPDQDDSSFWTEEAYLALGETKTKIELIDGGLWVSPSSSNPHNDILGNLLPTMKRAAREAGLRAYMTPNVRLAPGRILIPDIAVGKFTYNAAMNSASEVMLVVEITSPGNAAIDRTLKRRLYAESKIDWYLLVEPDFKDNLSLSVVLLRRDGDEYIPHATANWGETLEVEEPLRLAIATEDLIEP
jgi:Uma2 family endonuclease